MAPLHNFIEAVFTLASFRSANSDSGHECDSFGPVWISLGCAQNKTPWRADLSTATRDSGVVRLQYEDHPTSIQPKLCHCCSKPASIACSAARVFSAWCEAAYCSWDIALKCFKMCHYGPFWITWHIQEEKKLISLSTKTTWFVTNERATALTWHVARVDKF